jgi:hypothetical protein
MKSRSTCLGAISLGTGLGLLLSLGAAAEDIRLRSGYSPGDQYVLSLTTVTHTDVSARGAEQGSFKEDVELRYDATVEVVETDTDGAPVRERHEGVDLTYVRPDGSGSLFKKGAAFEVLRKDGGAIQIYFRGARVEAKIEKIVGDLLTHQFEYAVGALVDPGRPVQVGETWTLEANRVQEFLRARGMQGVELDGPATATLGEGKGDQLAIRYRIPIDSFALSEMPLNAQTARSHGRLEGEVQLDANALHRPVVHSSELALRMKGAMQLAGSARTSPWSLRRSQSVEQRTQTVKDQLASSR